MENKRKNQTSPEIFCEITNSPVKNPTKKSRASSKSPKKALMTNDFSFLFEDDNDFQFVDTDEVTTDKENSAVGIFAKINKNQISNLDLTTWKRCIIQNIQRDPKNYDYILELREENGTENAAATCRLQTSWCHTQISLNDLVSVRAVWNEKFKCYVVNNEQGFFITNPDNLISGTSVVGSLFCKRKSILQSKFQGIVSDNNKIMVIGSIIHELLQIILREKLSTPKQVAQACQKLLNSKEMIFTLYSTNMTAQDAQIEIQKFLPKIVDFVEQYVVGNKNPPDGCFAGRIDDIQDIEENLWVPQLGLKGKIDVSVNIRHRNNKLFNSNFKKYMPLELKTGRASFSNEHKGQVILYQMMLSEIGKTVDSGLLLYLREGIMKEVSATRHEQRDLIILRNEVAHYLTRNVQLTKDELDSMITKFNKIELPEPIYHHSACSNCAYNTICSTFLKKDETITLSDNHPLKKVAKECTEHLKPSDIEYFIHWNGLLSLEDQEARKTNQISSIWKVSPEERSKRGRTIIDLKVFGEVIFLNERYMHTFIEPESGIDLTLFGIAVGDYVTVSSKKQVAIASGHVNELTKTSIRVFLERNLTENYSKDVFIIDKHDSISGNTFNFTSLGALLDNEERTSHLRKIIVDKVKPTFLNVLPKIIANEGANILVELNTIQRNAVLKALTANDYMLIKGLPGTGKTQTLIALIRLLNMIGKSVLVTSHTHSAVDNLLVRLKKTGIKFLRLGSDARISSELLEYSESSLTQDCKTPTDLKQVYSSYNIVGVTCLGTAHSIFSHRKFDVCIIDEATQVFQPTAIRPLLFADKFILVGDPQQLPPIVKSNQARLLGADESLFHRLDSSEATSILSMQYRMNKTITKLANDLTYGGDLKCANDEVAKSSINIPNLIKISSSEKWLQKTLEKHIDQSVILLNTHDCFDRSCQFSSSKLMDPSQVIERNFSEETGLKKNRKFRYTNYCDAAVVFRLIKALITAGYSAKDIGVIAPYRAQVELLRKLATDFCTYYKKKDSGNMAFEGLEVNTVDQYQGRDKECIIYSCTKTGQPVETLPANNSNNIDIGEILEDRRRLTVAITRSKHKLIIVGDEKFLIQYTPFKDMFSKIPSRCKVLLEDGKLGFSWENIFAELNDIMEE